MSEIVLDGLELTEAEAEDAIEALNELERVAGDLTEVDFAIVGHMLARGDQFDDRDCFVTKLEYVDDISAEYATETVVEGLYAYGGVKNLQESLRRELSDDDDARIAKLDDALDYITADEYRTGDDMLVEPHDEWVEAELDGVFANIDVDTITDPEEEGVYFKGMTTDEDAPLLAHYRVYLADEM